MRFYEFEHSSIEHEEWYHNLRLPDDIIHITGRINLWFKCLSHYNNPWDCMCLYEVDDWLEDNHMTYPFTNEDDIFLFRLTFE